MAHSLHVEIVETIFILLFFAAHYGCYNWFYIMLVTIEPICVRRKMGDYDCDNEIGDLFQILAEMHSPEKVLDDPANEDSNVSVELETSISRNGGLQEENDLANTNLENSNALANGLSSMLINIIRDFDSKADDTLKSQSQLSSSLDRITIGRITITLLLLCLCEIPHWLERGTKHSKEVETSP